MAGATILNPPPPKKKNVMISKQTRSFVSCEIIAFCRSCFVSFRFPEQARLAKAIASVAKVQEGEEEEEPDEEEKKKKKKKRK